MDKILQKYILRMTLLLAMLLSPMMANKPVGIDVSMWLNSGYFVNTKSWETMFDNSEWVANYNLKKDTKRLNFHSNVEIDSSETTDLSSSDYKFHATPTADSPMRVFSVQDPSQVVDYIFSTEEFITTRYKFNDTTIPWHSGRVALFQDAGYGGKKHQEFSEDGDVETEIAETVNSLALAEGYSVEVRDKDKIYKAYTFKESASDLDKINFTDSNQDIENDIYSVKIIRLPSNTGDDNFPNPNTIISSGASIQNELFLPLKYQKGVFLNRKIKNFYEVIVSKTNTTPEEEIKIMSYLSLKYGITYAHDYVSSSGVTFYTFKDEYKTNIFGLGKDGSFLHQKVAQAEKIGDFLRISTNTDFTSLNSATRPELTNGQYFVISDNNKDRTSFPTTKKQIGSIGFSQVSDRIWRVQNTGGVSKISMKFNSSNLDDTWILVASNDDTFTDAKVLAPLKGGQVSLKGLDSFNSVFYLRLYKKSNSTGYSVTTKVILPSNDKGEVLLNYNKIGIKGLEATSKNNIYTVSN
ncbi:MAG: hypothetical protein QM493_10720 [Sulfurovum sp.]